MKNLIKRYQEKIEKYDLEIKSITKTIRKMRKDEYATMYFDDIEEAVEERSKIVSLRQQLFQVTKDLEDYI
jgi:hypothetical protein